MAREDLINDRIFLNIVGQKIQSTTSYCPLEKFCPTMKFLLAECLRAEIP